MKNVFDAIVEREHANDTKLGLPSTDPMHKARRPAIMERMTGGRGFSSLPKWPKTNGEGLTRGERKRAMRATANAKGSEVRDTKFMHSAARRRAQEMAVAA